jgi:Domain of unknown function (DUF4350)
VADRGEGSPTVNDLLDRRFGWPARIGLGVFGALLAWQFVSMVSGTATTETSPQGRSSYSRDAQGLAAAASLLAQYGIEVERVRGVLDSPPDTNATVFLIDPVELDPAEADHLLTFVLDGGRLVVGGPYPFYLDRYSSRPPDWRPAGRDTWDAADFDPDLGTIATANEGEFGDPGAGTIVVGSRTSSLITREQRGAGEVTFIADPTFMTNDLIGSADNAALVVELAGERARVLFIEGVHGVEAQRGWAAIPSRWRTALIGLLIAGAILMWARGTRFGPPEFEVRALDPSRSEYVHALADTLVRTGAAPPPNANTASATSQEQP